MPDWLLPLAVLLVALPLVGWRVAHECDAPRSASTAGKHRRHG